MSCLICRETIRAGWHAHATSRPFGGFSAPSVGMGSARRGGCPILRASEGWGTDASGARWGHVCRLPFCPSSRPSAPRKRPHPSPALVYDKDGAPFATSWPFDGCLATCVGMASARRGGSQAYMPTRVAIADPGRARPYKPCRVRDSRRGRGHATLNHVLGRWAPETQRGCLCVHSMIPCLAGDDELMTA